MKTIGKTASAALLMLMSQQSFANDDRGINDFEITHREVHKATFFQVNEDCSTKRGYNVAVARLPSNGSVTLIKETRTIRGRMAFHAPTFELNRILTRCFGKEISVISVVYKPKANFVGFDDFDVDVLRTDGTRSVIRIYGSVID